MLLKSENYIVYLLKWTSDLDFNKGGCVITVTLLLPTAREGNVFTGVCLSTIGHMATRSLAILVTARSVRILLVCFLVV